jgi:hypothetical protein
MVCRRVVVPGRGSNKCFLNVNPMKKATLCLLSLLSIPLAAQKIFVYPRTVTAPRGSYQTITAIITDVSDKTVTWSASGGKLVGTNPCVVNEPCTIALFSTEAGNFTLKASSNANHEVAATSTVTFTVSPTPRTDHPRFMMTADMLASLRSKATSANPMYQGIRSLANNYYTKDSSVWTFSRWNGSTCTGGSEPTSDQSANYRENDAWWMALVGLLDADTNTRNQYGCAARDVFVTNIGYVLSGKISLGGGNRWSDGANEWAFTADYLMGAGYLSKSDLVVVRQYLARLAFEQMNDAATGSRAVVGKYNSATQFVQSNEFSATGMRAMGNNYTQSRVLILTAAALTFNDDSTDDPPLANTCDAARYQVCPDGTAGSLHAYWTYVTGGLLYKEWANMEDPAVVLPAFNDAYHNLPSQPMCNTAWHTPISCLGSGRGGESSEGTVYGNSLTRLRWAMNAVHTAGFDDPMKYGPQMSIGTMSYWDLRYVADLTLLTGLSGDESEQARWNYLTDGDSLYYYTYPSNYAAESAMLNADALTGRTDRAPALEWLVMNTAFGMASGRAGNCKWFCGFDKELDNDYAAGVVLDMFLAMKKANVLPPDPRASLPTDWYDAGNQHIVTRTGKWTTGSDTIFSYYCTNTQIDHEHQFCGGFDLYSNGEYITKGRMEFNDYNDEMSVAWNKNTLSLIQYPGQTECTSNPWCQYWQSATDGGQWWHGYQAGLTTLYHSELPSYIAAIAEDHNAYNAGWGGYLKFNTVTAASRSLIYLRNSNQVIYYDRGATGAHGWDKATYLVTTGAPTVSGNKASWHTRSGKQKVYWTALEPAGKAPQLDMTYKDANVPNDWEVYGRLKVDAGNVPSARFLSVLEWVPASSSEASASRVESSAGTSLEGALVGSSLVMFRHDWPASFTTATYPASGATTQYVSDLSPNTTYAIAGAGAPTSGTTDTAGVLVFPATGTGNITVSAQEKGKSAR